MPIVDEVAQEVAAVAQQRISSEEFVRLSAFYEEMKERGLVMKQRYELPLIDTIGRSIHTSSSAPLRPR